MEEVEVFMYDYGVRFEKFGEYRCAFVDYEGKRTLSMEYGYVSGYDGVYQWEDIDLEQAMWTLTSLDKESSSGQDVSKHFRIVDRRTNKEFTDDYMIELDCEY